MTDKEFNEKVGEVFGIKSGVIAAKITLHKDNHLNQRIGLVLTPTIYQAKKLKELFAEFTNMTL